MTSNRLEWVDNLKAFTMILVIAGHCQLVTEIPRLMPAIYSFHMPLFFILSGFFVKNKPLVGVAEFKLAKYYLVTGIIIALFMIIFKNSSVMEELLRIIWANGTPNGGGLFHGMPSITALWFLAALIVGRIIYKFLPQKGYDENFTIEGLLKNPALYISVLLAIMAVYASKYIRMPLCLLAGINAVCYLFIGNQIRRSGYLRMLPVWLLLIIGLPVLLYNALFGFSVVSVCSYSLGTIGYVSGIVVSMLMIKLFEKYGNFTSKALRFLGQNTLIILCVHCFMDFFVLKGIEFLPHNGMLFPVELIIRISYTLLITFIFVKIRDSINSNKSKIVCQ